MSGTEERRPVTFAGTQLARSRHVCAFFDTTEQRYRTLAPFVREGLERGEQVVHIVDPRRRAEHESQLAAGIGTIGGLSPGQHDVLTWDDAYLRDGYFDPDRMIAQLTALLTDGERRYPLVRLAAHMEWALEDRPGVERLVEYEARLNYTLLGSKNPVI